MNYAVLPVNLEEPLDQGDILRRIIVVKNPTGVENTPVETTTSNVIVLSQGCEIDKAIKRSGTALVACVFNIDNLPKGDQGNVRKNIVLSLFHLPLEPPLPIECYIDWRTIQPISVHALVEARADVSRYICTVQGELIKTAKERFWDSFFRPMPFERNAREAVFDSELAAKKNVGKLIRRFAAFFKRSK